jgi:RNA polymerase sigma factor (sigma-70 family)
MKTTDELLKPEAASVLADDQGVESLALRKITQDEPVTPVSPPPERKEALDHLVQHIAKLPATTKKILALYYYENFGVSEIAACSNLSKQQVYEILSRTRGLLRRLLSEGVGADLTE